MRQTSGQADDNSVKCAAAQYIVSGLVTYVFAFSRAAATISFRAIES